MLGLDDLEVLFVAVAFLFQIVLIVHFALRKWNFDLSRRYGWIVYALSVPAAAVSVLLLLGGKTWSLWLGGFIYLIWAVYGYTVGPYVLLYLATVMFYWWPLGLISRPLWVVVAVLFILSTTLNVTSHKGLQDRAQTA